jgi:hypothetical protein
MPYEFTFNPIRSTTNLMQQRATVWYANSFVDYLNGLKLKDEYGNILMATYEMPVTGYNGGTGGSFYDAMIRLYEKGIEKALNGQPTADAVGN